MDNLDSHWDNIYSNTKENKLGWFEDDLKQTLKFMNLININKDATIFLSGVGDSKIADIFIQKNFNVIINDISQKALEKTFLRNIKFKKNLHKFHHNLSHPFPNHINNINLWIDRAVLHFLLEENDVVIYFDNLKKSVQNKGYVLFAEFAENGATSCAGLEIKRYSTEKFSYYLGDKFQLIKEENYTYLNPNGDKRPYIYALFQKSST
jgi:hypothetical protein